MAELNLTWPRPSDRKPAAEALMSCSPTPTKCSSICTADGPMTAWNDASKSTAVPSCSSWMILASNPYQPRPPPICTMSSTNATNTAAFCSPLIAPRQNGLVCSVIPSWPPPASIVSVIAPRSSSFAVKVSEPKTVNISGLFSSKKS